MKTYLKVLLGITLSFMCVFACLGYAGVSSQLEIFADADYVPPRTVFITSVTESGSAGGSSTVNSHINTIMNVDVSLGNDAASTVTMHVTVFNNTTDYYAFKGVLYTEGEYTYDNTNIVLNVSGMDIGYKLAPGQTASLDITFKYKEYQQNPETLSAILDVHFGLAGEDEGTDYESYIHAFLTNVNGYGLNDTNKKGTEVLSNLQDHGMLFADDNLKGGNLKHLLNAVNSTQTEGLTFIYDYVSETEVILYTYEEKYNSSSYRNQSITLYKTIFSRESVGSGSYTKWEPSSHIKGTATVKQLKTPAGTTVYAADVSTWKTEQNP